MGGADQLRFPPGCSQLEILFCTRTFLPQLDNEENTTELSSFAFCYLPLQFEGVTALLGV